MRASMRSSKYFPVSAIGCPSALDLTLRSYVCETLTPAYAIDYARAGVRMTAPSQERETSCF